jgi:hypothetical protein
LKEITAVFVFQGKLTSEQHIRELCGSMIDGEDLNLSCPFIPQV